MRIWKRVLAIMLTLALVVPTPVFAEEYVEDYEYPEALTPELDDSYMVEDDYIVGDDEDYGLEDDYFDEDYGVDEGGYLEPGSLDGLIEEVDADSGNGLQDAMMPEMEIGFTEETEMDADLPEETDPSEMFYRVVLDDMIEGASVECPDQAAAGETVPVLVRADGEHSIRSVTAYYYDASFEGHQIDMAPLAEDADGIYYEFIMPDADVSVYVMTEALYIEEPVLETVPEIMTEEPVSETAAEIMTEEPVSETAVEIMTEEPVSEAAAEIMTEEPVSETAAEITTEAPILETETVTEAPVIETEVVTEEPVSETAAEITTEAPVIETEVMTEEPAVETETEVMTEAPVVETEVMTEEPTVETETEVMTEAPAVETETEIMTEAPVVETETEVMTEEPVLETETEIMTEASVIETETEVMTEEPTVETETEVMTEAPAVETETEIMTEEPVLETETEIMTEAPVIETETEVMTEEPAVETETEIMTEAPVVETETEVMTEAPAVETEVMTEEPAVETETEIMTEAPVLETETVTEAPVVETETEVMTEAPVVETETEVMTEEPAAETETEVMTEAPAVETETEVMTEEPAVETETEVMTEAPVIEMTFPVQIVWEEGDDLRPEQITVALQKQSAGDQSWATVETLELSAENNWQSEFPTIIEEQGSSYRVRELSSSDVAVEDGGAVTYELDETGETVPHTWQNSHTPDYGYSDAGTAVLTKTPLDVPLSKSFSVEIAWDAKEEKYPSFVYAALQRHVEGEEDWETVDRVRVNAEDDWKAEFAPVSATRKDSFRILEESSDSSLVQDTGTAVFMDQAGEREQEFQVSYTESTGVLWGSCMIRNTAMEKDVKVNLVWGDAYNDDGLRPEEVRVTLMADGADTGTDLLLSAADLWNGSFMDLPLRDQDTEELISYTVSVPDTEVITGEDGITTYLAEVSRSEEDEDAWTITLRHTPRMKEIACQVTFDDQNNQDGKRPDTTRVVLTSSAWDYGYADIGSEFNREFVFESRHAVRNGKEVQFQISPAEVPGYESLLTQGDPEYIEEDHTIREHYMITFSRAPERTSLKGSIVWIDDLKEAGETEAEGDAGETEEPEDRPEKVTVRLMAGGEEIRQIQVSEPWTFEFDNLDLYRDGTLMQYDVTQDPVENYTLAREHKEGAYTFINTKAGGANDEQATIDVSVQVEYDDADNQDGIRPDSVTLQLKGSAEKEQVEQIEQVEQAEQAEQGEQIEQDEQSEQIADEASGWSAEFKNLPEDGVYNVTLSSDSVITGSDGPGTYQYEITGNQAEGFTVRLTHTPETVTLNGLINWEDDDDREGKRPDEVTVHLLKEGEEADISDDNQSADSQPEDDSQPGDDNQPADSQPEDDSRPADGQSEDDSQSADKYVVTSRSSEGWKWSFEDVPKYEDGQEILYTVSLDAVDSYATTVDGFEITNTYVAPSFTTHSLLLSGEIGINFFLDLPEAEGVSYEDSYMEFRINSRNARTMEEGYDPEFRDVNGEGYYGFTAYVSSNEMAEPVTAVFHYGDGQTLESTYSVRDYIIAYEEVQDQFDAQTTALVHAMADYGHYVQPALSQNNGWIIGKDYKEMDKFYTSSYDYSEVENAVAGFEITRDTGDSDIESITYALNLLTRTQVYLYFMFREGYRGGFGASVDGSPVVMIKQNTRVYAQTPDYTAHQLDERHDVIAWSNSGTASVSVSPLDYVHAAIGAGCDTSTRNAAAAIYYYYQAAQAYRATH